MNTTGLEWFGPPERNTLRPLCVVLLVFLSSRDRDLHILMSSIMHATAHHVLVTLINLHNNNQYVVPFNLKIHQKTVFDQGMLLFVPML